MEDLQIRSPSCNGVSFEMNSKSSARCNIGRETRSHFSDLNTRIKSLGTVFNQGIIDSTKSLSQLTGQSLSRRSPSISSSTDFCDLEYDQNEHSSREDPEAYAQQEVPEEQYDLKALKHEQIPTKPAAPESRLSVILLDQGLFTVYKCLFVICLALNLTGLIAAASSSGCFPYAKNRPALFSIGNILALVLCRSEAFLRLVFWLAVTLFGRPWIPLRLKTAITAFLQSLGGIHSGCGVSSVIWLIYALLQSLNHREKTSPEIIGIAATILGLLLCVSAAAFPLVRHLHHNLFERIHRFAGWTALAFLWIFVILTFTYDPATKSYNASGKRIIRTQEFWFTVIITVLIMLPWLSVRRVAVNVSAPSGHASLIKFNGGIKAGILGRISRSPLSEWHAFGIISDGKDEHMMLAGAVGDFTKGLVSSPPRHLYVRSVHFAGLPYLINMYNRVVVVATGSGICVFLSFLLQSSPADVYLIWVAKAIEKNFGDEIASKIKNYDAQKKIVCDTAISGRPDVPDMTVKAVKEWGAEVVIVTSNPSGSRDVVNGCKAVGIPAFGPIWDS